MLTAHFTAWKAKHFQGITFYEDGIINVEEYNRQNTKLLVIAKEPNGSNHKEDNGHMSFCEEWNGKKPTYGFALRIAEWAVGMLDNFPVFSSITPEMKYAHLKKIAFMNVKKSKGTGKTEDIKGLNALVLEQIDFIRTQIYTMNPDVVILCLSHSESLRNLLFPDAKEKWVNSGYEVMIAKSGHRKLIDFYHPSSRNVAAAAYCLLKNVVQSEAYQKLDNNPDS